MYSLGGLATLLFGGIADKYSNLFAFVKNNLPKADIKIPFRTYISIGFFISSFVFLACLLFLIFALQIVKIPLIQTIVYSIFLPLVMAIVCFIAIFFYPLQRSAARAKNIESNLPFVLTHMGAISESGISPYVVFKLVSKFEEYGEISRELKKIVKSVDNFGIDPLTAIKQVASRTPSEEFKQVLLGFATTTESGGDVKKFLKSAGQEALFEWRAKREKFLNQLSTYAEFYTGIMIAAPLFIIALFSVMGMIEPTMGGYNLVTLTKLSIYFIIPVLNTGFLLFLRGIEVKM